MKCPTQKNRRSTEQIAGKPQCSASQRIGLLAADSISGSRPASRKELSAISPIPLPSQWFEDPIATSPSILSKLQAALANLQVRHLYNHFWRSGNRCRVGIHPRANINQRIHGLTDNPRILPTIF